MFYLVVEFISVLWLCDSFNFNTLKIMQCVCSYLLNCQITRAENIIYFMHLNHFLAQCAHCFCCANGTIILCLSHIYTI